MAVGYYSTARSRCESSSSVLCRVATQLTGQVRNADLDLAEHRTTYDQASQPNLWALAAAVASLACSTTSESVKLSADMILDVMRMLDGAVGRGRNGKLTHRSSSLLERIGSREDRSTRPHSFCSVRAWAVPQEGLAMRAFIGTRMSSSNIRCVGPEDAGGARERRRRPAARAAALREKSGVAR
eukprot:scaffold226_cov167-Pinguiococcus_pyrenoidosus.AAC.2